MQKENWYGSGKKIRKKKRQITGMEDLLLLLYYYIYMEKALNVGNSMKQNRSEAGRIKKKVRCLLFRGCRNSEHHISLTNLNVFGLRVLM